MMKGKVSLMINWAILDLKEVYREDLPGGTFRVLKEKEIKNIAMIDALR
jgi:hypothetical protein